MEEVAAKRSELVRMAGATVGGRALIPHISQLPPVIPANAGTSRDTCGAYEIEVPTFVGMTNFE
tara:strand:- start:73 stop:264 length:192 start_codon:yes stop_codon:yes gene_type:complete